jgi:hypothetical protein
LRFLKKVSLGICIKLYQLIYLNIPDLERRIFQQTDTIFSEIEIQETNSDMILFEIEIAFQSRPCLMSSVVTLNVVALTPDGHVPRDAVRLRGDLDDAAGEWTLRKVVDAVLRRVHLLKRHPSVKVIQFLRS